MRTSVVSIPWTLIYLQQNDFLHQSVACICPIIYSVARPRLIKRLQFPSRFPTFFNGVPFFLFNFFISLLRLYNPIVVAVAVVVIEIKVILTLIIVVLLVVVVQVVIVVTIILVIALSLATVVVVVVVVKVI